MFIYISKLTIDLYTYLTLYMYYYKLKYSSIISSTKHLYIAQIILDYTFWLLYDKKTKYEYFIHDNKLSRI
jgi:hypothetical protein